MIGWDIRVIRGGELIRPREYPGTMLENGEQLLYIPPTGVNQLEYTPNELAESAIEVLCSHGYPFLFRIRVGDLPYEIDADEDEVVYVQAWDQS